jgi:branched-chain amino acid aminotransferase
MIAYANNIFIEEEKATLQVGDLAIQRGYAAFDYLRTKNYIPLFLEDYIHRFFRSANLLHLHPARSKDEVISIIYELMEKNKIAESGIRMILTGGYSLNSYEPTLPSLVILQQNLQLPAQEKFTKGVKVISYEYQRDLPHIKSINYLMGIWLQQKLKAGNAEDVLYFNDGIVSELPRANVFMVTKDKIIITPKNNILFGITRLKLLELAVKKFKIEERDITIEEVKTAEEVFMTSTTKRILPINQVDDVIIGNGKTGPVTSFLNEAFIRMEDEITSLS